MEGKETHTHAKRVCVCVSSKYKRNEEEEEETRSKKMVLVMTTIKSNRASIHNNNVNVMCAASAKCPSVQFTSSLHQSNFPHSTNNNNSKTEKIRYVLYVRVNQPTTKNYTDVLPVILFRLFICSFTLAS